MAVTGGYKTLLPERDWSKLKMNNQNLELRKAKMVFRPYGTLVNISICICIYICLYMKLQNFKSYKQ